jgi:hypothetical protein
MKGMKVRKKVGRMEGRFLTIAEYCLCGKVVVPFHSLIL